MRRYSHLKKTGALYSISVIAFLSALHTSIPNYFNSSFLSTFTDERTVSFVYLVISLLTIVGLLFMHNILRKFGNFKTSLTLIIIQIIIFYGLITTTSSNLILFLFIIGMSIISLIGLTIDIFLQKSTELGHTGSVRGLFMTATNAAWILGPLIGGMLIIGDNYRGVYIAGFSILLPLLYVVQKNFNKFKDSHYIEMSTRQAIIRVLKNPDISKIFFINIILQTFYAWMTVYTPIYLHNSLHFSLNEISIIFTIMLIPFILVEYPLGILADKKLGEKEMMFLGFVIMGLSTCVLIFFDYKSLIIWSLFLFITRIGAATAEIMIETYFFKKIDGKDPELLSLFRITRPFSYFVAPIITIIGLAYTSDKYLFLILGVICLLTLYPISKIRDTN